jgi:peptidoglycan/LPS O-acetylase OafA/YrhL
MAPSRIPFLDWMKCLGMAAIVFWHVSPYGILLVPPIYPKQLGVAFFLFATGFSLAREIRPTAEVLFRRAFDVYLLGLACALLLSAVHFATIGDLNESNYLPFLLGVNVFMTNGFPANPTTWYIGTYIHFLLVWALFLRRARIQPWMLAVCALAEIAIRAWLTETFGLFVAYMALPNWATVFLMGCYHGQNNREIPLRSGPIPWAAGLILALAVWAVVARPWVTAYSFPLMSVRVGSRAASLVVASSAVSLVYLGLTWMTFQLTRRLGRSAVVEFLARNTLLVFLTHMPLYYFLNPLLKSWTNHTPLRVLLLFLACFPALAAASELTLRLVRPRVLRDRLWSWMHRPGPAEKPAVEVP